MGQDGKPVLIVRHLQERINMCKAFVVGFGYLEARITGTCNTQYSCVEMQHPILLHRREGLQSQLCGQPPEPRVRRLHGRHHALGGVRPHLEA